MFPLNVSNTCRYADGKVQIIIKPKPTKVVGLQRAGGKVVQDCEVYIGRACNMGGWNLPASIWGNPYKVDSKNDIDSVLIMYEKYVRSKPELMSRLKELKGKTLGCFCKQPKKGGQSAKCHGDVLVK